MCVRVRVRVRVCVRVHVRVSVRVRVRVSVRVSIRVRVLLSACIHIHSFMYTYIHSCTHTFIHDFLRRESVTVVRCCTWSDKTNKITKKNAQGGRGGSEVSHVEQALRICDAFTTTGAVAPDVVTYSSLLAGGQKLI